MSILQIHQIEKYYGSQAALSSISLEIPSSGIFGLLGPNGAGKTTLIRIINQIIEQDKGQIFFEGEPLQVKHIPQIGYMPEERGLYKKMAVGEQLVYFARLKGLSANEAKTRINHWLKKLDILSWKDKKIEDLSKGMSQKIQFITSIIHEPKLLILDEPFSGFDPVNAEIIKDEILELKKNGTSLILSTHRMDSVELLCDQVAMLHRSQKVLEGSISEIKKRFRPNQYVIKIIPNGKSFPESWDVKLIDGIAQFTLGIDENQPNDLLEQIFPYGQVVSFQEILPSIEEIFIQQVKSDSNG